MIQHPAQPAAIDGDHPLKKAFAGREKRFCLRSDSWLSMRAHIIGVRVSDTTAEIRIATARVMANSRNRRPDIALNSSGISTAISEKVRR